MDEGELRARLRKIEARLADREEPAWKRRPKTFWGAAFGVILLAGTWYFPRVWADVDPAVPRFVHRDILMTDTAIESMLALSSTQDERLASSGSKVLFQGIKNLLIMQLTNDIETQSIIAATARKMQSRTYTGSTSFWRTAVARRPLSCLLAEDEVLANKFIEGMPALIEAGIVDPQEIFSAAEHSESYSPKPDELKRLYAQALENWCALAASKLDSRQDLATQRALLLSYKAKAKDKVILRIKTIATGVDSLAIEDDYKLIEYGLSDGSTPGVPTAILRSDMVPEPGVATIMLTSFIGEGDQERYVSIDLNDKGRACISGAPLTEMEKKKGIPQECSGRNFFINVAASISVEPQEATNVAP